MGRRQKTLDDFLKRLEQENNTDIPWSDLTDRIDNGTLVPIIGNAVMNDQIFYFAEAGSENTEGQPLAWSVEERDGRYLISGSRDNIGRVWDLDPGAQLAILQGHTGAVLTMSISADGQTIATGSGDKTIRLWDLQDCIS